MQKITICGNLTKDPVISEREWVNKETGEITKASVCNFTVAVDEWVGSKKNTEFFGVSAWRKLGEICYNNLKKGNPVVVYGSVRLNNFVSSNNNFNSRMEIRADEIKFFGNRKDKVEQADTEEPDVF